MYFTYQNIEPVIGANLMKNADITLQGLNALTRRSHDGAERCLISRGSWLNKPQFVQCLPIASPTSNQITEGDAGRSDNCCPGLGSNDGAAFVSSLSWLDDEVRSRKWLTSSESERKGPRHNAAVIASSNPDSSPQLREKPGGEGGFGTAYD
jgi:hypothetical protein